MKLPSIDKWVLDITPDDPIRDVAVHTLQARLAAVQHYLPLAAEKAEEDIEYVHELRVWTRRAEAALELYADFLPHRRAVGVAKQLKRLRRVANDARDYDVLAQRLAKDRSHPEAEQWLVKVRAQRVEAQPPIVAMHKRLQHHDRFARRVEKLLRRIRSHGRKKIKAEKPCFGDWARARLRQLVEHYFEAIPVKGCDEAVLHQFRIRGKRLRYAMELLAGPFLPGFRENLYPLVETLQDKLGEINDGVTEQARLCRQIAETSAAREAEHLRRLLADEEARLEQSRQAFFAWCTPRFLERLHAEFDGMLAKSERTRAPLNNPRDLPISSTPPDIPLHERTGEVVS